MEEIVYLVSAVWYNRWKRTNGGAGPADTRSLIDERTGNLRARLVEGFDYVVLCQTEWEAVACTGVDGPELACRRNIESGTLDLYPVRVRVARADAETGMWQDSHATTVLISKYLPLKDLESTLRDACGIAPECKVRLHGGLYGDDFELIRTTVGSVEESPWCNEKNEMRVLIEIARDDGTWPREVARRSRRKSSSVKRPRPDGSASMIIANDSIDHDDTGRKRKGSRETGWSSTTASSSSSLTSGFPFFSDTSTPFYGGPLSVKGPAVVPPPAWAFASIPGDKGHQTQQNNSQSQVNVWSRTVGNQVPSLSVGVCGLVNLGNTCYMNAVLQSLNQVQQLVKWFVDESKANELAGLCVQNQSRVGFNPLTSSFAELIRMMWNSQHSIISPGNFVNAVKTKEQSFDNVQQHDAHEFLLFLLNRLHQETNRRQGHQPSSSARAEEGMDEMKYYDRMEHLDEVSSPGLSVDLDQNWMQRAEDAWMSFRETDDSFILDLFQGQYESRLHCEACSHVSCNFETFLSLSLPLVVESSAGGGLEECLRSFLSTEILDASEQWYCSRCGDLRQASKKINLIGDFLPRVLIIHLKRFKANGDKITSVVQFPVENLDIAPLIASSRTHVISGFHYMDEEEDSCMGEQLNSALVYDLVAVTRHIGSQIQGGHYVAQVLTSDRSWRMMDDSSVSTTHTEPPDGSDPDAYLLFYKRKDTF